MCQFLINVCFSYFQYLKNEIPDQHFHLKKCLGHLSLKIHNVKFDIGYSTLGFTSYHMYQKSKFSFARSDKDSKKIYFRHKFFNVCALMSKI